MIRIFFQKGLFASRWNFCGLVFTNFFEENIDQEIFLLVWLSILYLGWTMFQIPYLSIGYDLEKNYF